MHIAIIFLRNKSLSLTHSSVHQNQSMFPSVIAAFRIKIQDADLRFFP